MNALYHQIFDSKRVVIFDIDGTLVDVMDIHTQAYIDTIREITGVHVKSYADVTKHYGIQNQETMRRVLNDHQHPFTEETIEKLVARRGEMMASPTAPISAKNILPGVIHLLESLQAEGKIIATITGNSRKVGESVITRSTLVHFFPVRVFGDDVVNGKPVHGRHEMIAHALKLIEERRGDTYSLDEVLVVGDMVPDVQGAQKAGVDSLAVATGGIPLEILQKEHPTFSVKSFVDLQ